jgi:hypothetical protein
VARVLVVDDDNPKIHVELQPDTDGRYDGGCNRPGCTWTVATDHERSASMRDAVESATIHLDHGRHTIPDPP